MRIGELRRLPLQGDGDLYDAVLLGEVLAEPVQGGSGLGEGQGALATPGDGRCHLHIRDAGDVEEMTGSRVGEIPGPGRAGFQDVTLDGRTGVEKVNRHRQRRSRMMVSESGSPWIGIGEKGSRSGRSRGGGLISLMTPASSKRRWNSWSALSSGVRSGWPLAFAGGCCACRCRSRASQITSPSLRKKPACTWSCT